VKYFILSLSFSLLLSKINTNVLRIRIGGAYSEPVTSNALGGLANEHRPLDAAAYSREHRCLDSNLTTSIDAHWRTALTSRSNLKRRSRIGRIHGAIAATVATCIHYRRSSRRRTPLSCLIERPTGDCRRDDCSERLRRRSSRVYSLLGYFEERRAARWTVILWTNWILIWDQGSSLQLREPC